MKTTEQPFFAELMRLAAKYKYAARDIGYFRMTICGIAIRISDLTKDEWGRKEHRALGLRPWESGLTIGRFWIRFGI